jgi:alpha-D-xyloside xylohydrolase
MRFIIIASALVCLVAMVLPARAEITRVSNGVEATLAGITIHAQFHGEATVRILKWTSQGSPNKTSLAVLPNALPETKVDVKETPEEILLSSDRLKVRIAKADGSVEFLDAKTGSLLKEAGKAQFEPVTYGKDRGFNVQQSFALTPTEGIYGLGQHQDGFMNYRGRSVTLVQANTQSAIPFLVSTRGYGLLWDNTSKTIFADGPNGLSVWSDLGDNLDYYFIGAANMDGAIAGYRQLTGAAPLYGKWAYGYWQSKEHYHTQDEVLAVAREYRQRGIPVDNIVQDWNYWGTNESWSGMIWDPVRYPKPDEMVRTLHDLNYHVMISVWGGLGPESDLYREMDQKGFLYKPVGWAGFRYYDAFNPAANDVYWKHLKAGLYSKGIDGWWLDSTEPDIITSLTKEATEYEMKRVEDNHLGSWARYLNGYPIMMTGALYDRLRKETDAKRVYILTRSAFAGQQRYATTTWSGDIGASWEIYRKQISAGLNYCMAGLPYWTFDIGGFNIGGYGGVFARGIQDPAYREIYTRMFQFGAFSPIFRAHGSEGPREIYTFGEFTDALVKADHLRYRLLPYIYSQAWQVTDKGSTLMRGLPMDFAADPKTYDIADQFMFGPGMMVCPVTEYQLHRPPEPSVRVPSTNFRTPDGKVGLKATYCTDAEHKVVSLERVDPDIHLYWYTGRPAYATSSTFSVRWVGKLVPSLSGPHQLHVKSHGTRRLFLDGKELPFAYASTEARTDYLTLEAGRAYDFVMETENTSTGAAKAELWWKTPDVIAKERQIEARPSTRQVYLPAGTQWTDFWSGAVQSGGQTVNSPAPIDRLPLFVRAGSMLPMGPLVQYATEKPANPIELRVYRGADGEFTLYEDEGDTYNYEKGVYALIEFKWNDAKRELVVEGRKGSFPGMLKTRDFHVVLVGPEHGTGIEVTEKPDRVVTYDGSRQTVTF